MTFLRYPAYKDSGVAWLGEIPSQWEIKPIKHVVTCNDEVLGESTPPNTELRYIEISDVSETQGVTNVQSIIFEDAPSRARRITQTGDIIISTVRTYLKAIAKIDYSLEGVIVSTGFAVLRPQNGVDVGFLSHAMRAPHFLDMVVAHSVGISYPAINTSDLIGFKLPFPPLPEQHAIAAFLDTETARIDTLVAKQVSLIATLQEKRRALISHVVTKGLDPAAPMKDSGVPWLGEVPKHWEVKPLGNISANIQTGPFGSQLHAEDYVEDGVPVINPAHIQAGYIVSDPSCTISETKANELLRYKMAPGDIVFGRRGEMGRCAEVLPEQAGWLCGTGSLRVELNHKLMLSRFAMLVLSNQGVKEQLELESVGSTMSNLNTTILSRLRLPLPSLQEQQRVIDILDQETTHIDTLITKSQEMIAVLREHRTALVAAAVTGQIDVREPSRESGRIK